MTDWLDRAFKREQRKRRVALAADQKHRREHPRPPPDPRLIQGGGAGDGYDGRYTEPLGLQPKDIRGRHR